MALRNEKGQFVLGHKGLTEEEKLKKARSLSEAWKNRPDYIADLTNNNKKIYNVWRGILFTEKGKNIGYQEEWRDFRTFFNDVSGTYKDGLLFRRKDTTKPYSKDNFVWVTKEEAGAMRAGAFLTIGDKTYSLKQWSEISGESVTAIKIRYYRHRDDFSPEEIVYGRKNKRGSKKAKDITDPSVIIRAKASRMISSYKCRDKKFGLESCDITIDWMIDNILTQKCVYCGDDKRIGCDRIDNNKGHTMDNVVPCCVECNAARNNYFTYEEMKEIGKVIREIKSRRKQ